jgi:hypothetical protein
MKDCFDFFLEPKRKPTKTIIADVPLGQLLEHEVVWLPYAVLTI